MNDMRRTLLWVVFTMSLLMLWDRWHVFNGEPSMFSPPKAVPTASHPASGATAPVAAAPAASGALAAAVTAAEGEASEPASERVTITTDIVRATLETRGADLVGLELLKYQEPDNHSAILRGFFKMIGRPESVPPKTDVKIFEKDASRFYVAQSGLTGEHGESSWPRHLTVMRLVSPERELAPGKNELKLRFESPVVGGVQLVKTYTFHRGQYGVDVSHEVINQSGAAISPQLYLQLVRDGHVESTGWLTGPSSYTGPAVYTAGKFSKVDFPDIDKGKAPEMVNPGVVHTDGWISMIQHYFASAWILPEQTARQYLVNGLKSDVNGVPSYSVGMLTPVGTLAPGQSKTLNATLFAGPQEERVLKPLAPGLELVKDYGWLKIIGEPLFWLLDKLHTLIGNWGWSIVALVVLLKVAFYGLNASAYRSMAKMKAVNPRIQELRARYKDKPQLMQQEMMKIYKEEKVNPLGGCLPILVQMPFFIALYSVLLSTAEMRGAPWIGWIHDLSSMDPWAILPLLMLGTSLLQVALQPTPTDPAQAKMMWIMPLAFSVMFFIFPSGLVLYWLTNNVLSIAQQWFINRQITGSAIAK
jgi:YidC/Oxa1 family membrane protein insertase